MPDKRLFPSTKEEALALAYVQGHDWMGKSPLDLYKMYEMAHSEIKKAEGERAKDLTKNNPIGV